VAKVGEEIAGFVSVTSPNKIGYSIDKYFRREDLPLNVDQDLYEARIPTVSEACRRQMLFLRDVLSMGKCFDRRTIRIAVKDRKTNTRMLEILRAVLLETSVEGIQEVRESL